MIISFFTLFAQGFHRTEEFVLNITMWHIENVDVEPRGDPPPPLLKQPMAVTVNI